MTQHQSHYSLRWNNHQTHILAAFDALLQAETLVDVTLVCAETSVRAHKVVLSACSPFFQRIFSENPCKHPVIVLKDFSGWEVQAIVDFMYKGEISVVQEQLQSLIKAAESLQVRGLANQDPFGVVVDKESSIINQTPTPSTSPNEFDRNYFGSRFPTPGVTVRTPAAERASPFSPVSAGCYEPTPNVRLPHMSRLSFPETLLPRPESQSPIPRRKQARPRRRSGEMCGPQDLSKQPSSPPPHSHQDDPAPENLSIKRQRIEEDVKVGTPDPVPSSPDMEMGPCLGKEFRASPPSLPSLGQLKQEMDGHSPLPFPPMPSVSALAMTPPHSKFFGLDSPLGLFPPGLDGCRNPLFDIGDHHRNPETQLFAKKKMGRPKGQHSAPRGGPPRSWTNAELTEALQHVWNKKMTTSQASRIFGIPYNSLLMYVRGKYGKSLKLEQLRKDCIGGPPASSLDLLAINNNNCNKNAERTEEPPPPPQNRPSSADPPHQPPPVFNPFHSFYPDFGTGFPIPVSMIHLLPQSEKSYGSHEDSDCKSERERLKKEVEEEEHHHAAAQYRKQLSVVDDRRELVQQNGQD